jgi:hypothetical protein
MGFVDIFDWTWAFVKVERRGLGKHLEVHKVRLPEYGEKGNYVQLLSLSAFAHNADKDKNRGCWSPDFLYFGKRWYEFIEDCECWEENARRSGVPLTDDRTLPCIEHNSLWDFYQAVGYDYKKKKWHTPA